MDESSERASLLRYRWSDHSGVSELAGGPCQLAMVIAEGRHMARRDTTACLDTKETLRSIHAMDISPEHRLDILSGNAEHILGSA